MASMKETEYYKSGKHVENALIARELALFACSANKEKRIAEYLKAPNLCTHCSDVIEYAKKQNKFCSKVCSATYNNKQRELNGWKRTQESKDKTSAAIVAAYGKLTDAQKAARILNHAGGFDKQPDVDFTCKVCGINKMIPYIQRNRRTCGADDCRVYASVGIRPYQNGTRKPVKFFNPYEAKEVLLDSSWEVEVANKLIELDIKWTRPKFVKWVDGEGKTRRYFPDFHLTEYDIYLDPKNPYCMATDKEKMITVSKLISLVYGDLTMILDYLEKLKIRPCS